MEQRLVTLPEFNFLCIVQWDRVGLWNNTNRKLIEGESCESGPNSIIYGAGQ